MAKKPPKAPETGDNVIKLVEAAQKASDKARKGKKPHINDLTYQPIAVPAEKKPAPRPMGRPTKYRPEFCEEVIELARGGRSLVEIAVALGVGKASLYDWSEKHPEFSTALAHARDVSQAWWEEQARMGLTLPGFNASLWAKIAFSRFPDDYQERRVLQSPDGGAIVQNNFTQINVAALDADEREALSQLLDAAMAKTIEGDVQ